MKTTLAILSLLFCLNCHALQIFAAYTGTYSNAAGVTNKITLLIVETGLAQIEREIAPGVQEQTEDGGYGGTWTLRGFTRTFFIENSKFTYRGTIRDGVVTGTYKHFVTGESFDFWITPDGNAPVAVTAASKRVRSSP
jgi:hypothetical protein